MKPAIELLAPGGDLDSIKAAIAAGADAVYCGLNKFNARNRAANLEFEELKGVIHLAHDHGCKVFLTLNILIMGSEFPALVRLLNKLVNTHIDGVIVQDLGLLYLLSTYYPSLDIHASTQLNTHNGGQIKFLNRLTASRVNLSRELNINEIQTLTQMGNAHSMSTEVFVHGSYCIGFSGLCYMSSLHGGNSGNRGRCSQPCRDKYLTTPAGKDFPLNLKDNSAYGDLKELSDAGVGSLKIEGRIKQFDYVYTVVSSWKKQLQDFYDKGQVNTDKKNLYKVFNRDFSNGYLGGNITKDMFIDNPRDHSIKQFSGVDHKAPDKIAYYADKEKTFTHVHQLISSLSIDKIPISVSIAGRENTPLTLALKTQDTAFEIASEKILVKKNRGTIAKCLTHDFLWERLGIINDSQYNLEHLDLENLEPDLFISFTEITAIRKRIFSRLNESKLNGAKEIIPPVDLPFLTKPSLIETPPALSVLLDDKGDLPLCRQISGDVFFQLPNGMNHDLDEYIDLFTRNQELIPWFPSVLMGEHYDAAKKLMEQVQPRQILTNNTGIAYEAYEKRIPWLAGPYMNMVNSFGLLCLQKKFNCSGAFMSNELSKFQTKRIIRPKDFKLYSSIYHPILLLSTRQCLLHQVTGCEKNAMDDTCIQTCSRSSPITNLNEKPLLIKKTRGNFHCLYNHHNYLNTDIVTDIPDIFSSFSIDLRNVKTHTRVNTDKAGVIKGFENLLKGVPHSKKEVEQMISPWTSTQYTKGI